MKIFFLLFAFCLTTYAYTQTTREEVVERYGNGSKKKVITYSGVGNSEKIIKVTHYGSLNSCFLNPHKIETYGNKVSGDYVFWEVVKTQYFKAGGASEDKTVLSP